MNSYEFLVDEEELRKFCDKVLPKLRPTESLCLYLAARRKYLKEEEKDNYVMSGTDMIKRIIIRDSSFDSVKNGILQLSIPKGTYKTKGGQVIPDHAFVVYMTINPSCGKMATIEMIHKLTDMLANNDEYYKIDGIAKTVIHKNISRKLYLDFDIDVADVDERKEIIGKVCNELGNSEYHVVMTRGGAHVLLLKSTLDPNIKNTFYKNIQEIGKVLREDEEISNKSITMTPIPGCSQGGKMPYIMP